MNSMRLCRGLVIAALCWSAAPAFAADPAEGEKIDSKDPVVRLLARIDRLEQRIATLEKKLAEAHPNDPISATGKFASDLVGGTLNAVGQGMDATGRALTGQPPREKKSSDADADKKSKPKNTFFGIPIE